MGVYVLLSKLTPEGRRTIKERPHRIKEVVKELKESGVKVFQQYATLGQYDFINIVEAPDNETISRISVDLCSRGTVEIVTLAAVPINSYVSTLKNAQIVSSQRKKG